MISFAALTPETASPEPFRPWNLGKLIGQKPPLKLREFWAIRIRLQIEERLRDLAMRLFVRTGRRMVATPAARVFAAEVSLSFDRVISAADACGCLGARRILRVSAPTTFAMRWLIPRLDGFHAERPEVEVVVTTATTLHDDLRGGFDVAIRRGSVEQDAWPQHRAVPFLSEVDTLIISPALFERQPVRHVADLANHVLLVTETRPGDWTD